MLMPDDLVYYGLDFGNLNKFTRAFPRPSSKPPLVKTPVRSGEMGGKKMTYRAMYFSLRLRSQRLK